MTDAVVADLDTPLSLVKDLDGDKAERAKNLVPQHFLTINWKEAFNKGPKGGEGPEVETWGSGDKCTKVARINPINVQFPEVVAPFGVDMGKEATSKPALTIRLGGTPVADLAAASYTEGEFYKGLGDMLVKHVGTMWPEKKDMPFNDSMVRWLLTKNTCALRDGLMNLKFFAVKGVVKTKIVRKGETERLPLSAIKRNTRMIPSCRITTLPFKDTLAVTIEILEIIITGEGDDSNDNNASKGLTLQDIQNTVFTNPDADAAVLASLAESNKAKATTDEVKAPPKKRSKGAASDKDGF